MLLQFGFISHQDFSVPTDNAKGCKCLGVWVSDKVITDTGITFNFNMVQVEVT